MKYVLRYIPKYRLKTWLVIGATLVVIAVGTITREYNLMGGPQNAARIFEQNTESPDRYKDLIETYGKGMKTGDQGLTNSTLCTPMQISENGMASIKARLSWVEHDLGTFDGLQQTMTAYNPGNRSYSDRTPTMPKGYQLKDTVHFQQKYNNQPTETTWTAGVVEENGKDVICGLVVNAENVKNEVGQPSGGRKNLPGNLSAGDLRSSVLLELPGNLRDTTTKDRPEVTLYERTWDTGLGAGITVFVHQYNTQEQADKQYAQTLADAKDYAADRQVENGTTYMEYGVVGGWGLQPWNEGPSQMRSITQYGKTLVYVIGMLVDDRGNYDAKTTRENVKIAVEQIDNTYMAAAQIPAP